MPPNKSIRRYIRIPLPKGIMVAWEYSGKRQISTISVLALGGLFVATSDPPPLGDVVRLIFEVPDGEVRARAIIRDCQRGMGMGIEFTHMRPEARAKLTRLIKRLTRNDSGPSKRAGIESRE